MNLKELKSPFPADDIEWRIQQSGVKNGKPWGLVLAYVTNRAIMERLDNVCGPEGWKNEYAKGPDGGILCGISIKCGDEWITKWDGAENTNVEAVKGGLSSAMKRAGSQWGIGRYLYKLSASWANFCANGVNNAKIKDNGGPIKWFKWNPPELPAWALPEGAKPAPKKEPQKSSPEKASGKTPPKIKNPDAPISDKQRELLFKKMQQKELTTAESKAFYESVLELSEKDKATMGWASDFIDNFEDYFNLYTSSQIAETSTPY